MPVIPIRMSAEEVAQVREAAAALNLRRAEYIRAMLGLGVYRRTGPLPGTPSNNPHGRPRKPRPPPVPAETAE